MTEREQTAESVSGSGLGCIKVLVRVRVGRLG